MDASLLFGISGAAAGLFAAGVAGLVFMRQRNGNGHAPPTGAGTGPTTSPRLVEEWQLAKMQEIMQPLTQLPQAIRAGMEPMVELIEQQASPPVDPQEAVRLRMQLEELTIHLQSQSVKNQAAIQSLDKGLERIGDMIAQDEPPAPPPVIVESPQLEDVAKRMEQALIAPLFGAPPPIPVKFVAPPTPFDTDVTLSMFNHFTLLEDEIYTLIPPDNGVHAISIANLGPGALYLRYFVDPDPADPHSELIPAGGVDNLIPIPVSLKVVANGSTCIISARLTYIN